MCQVYFSYIQHRWVRYVLVIYSTGVSGLCKSYTTEVCCSLHRHFSTTGVYHIQQCLRYTTYVLYIFSTGTLMSLIGHTYNSMMLESRLWNVFYKIECLCFNSWRGNICRRNSRSPDINSFITKNRSRFGAGSTAHQEKALCQGHPKTKSLQKGS